MSVVHSRIGERREGAATVWAERNGNIILACPNETTRAPSADNTMPAEYVGIRRARL